MALGARRADVVALVLRQGLTLVLAGLLLGGAGALALGRLMASFLFEVPPTDPLTFLAVGALLVGVATLACLLPARRAAGIDPMHALRAGA
jgi:ABC-type antimicrobial peptide transport system permease subunit